MMSMVGVHEGVGDNERGESAANVEDAEDHASLAV
jgi:hypothetical protein